MCEVDFTCVTCKKVHLIYSGGGYLGSEEVQRRFKMSTSKATGSSKRRSKFWGELIYQEEFDDRQEKCRAKMKQDKAKEELHELEIKAATESRGIDAGEIPIPRLNPAFAPSSSSFVALTRESDLDLDLGVSVSGAKRRSAPTFGEVENIESVPNNTKRPKNEISSEPSKPDTVALVLVRGNNVTTGKMKVWKDGLKKFKLQSQLQLLEIKSSGHLMQQNKLLESADILVLDERLSLKEVLSATKQNSLPSAARLTLVTPAWLQECMRAENVRPPCESYMHPLQARIVIKEGRVKVKAEDVSVSVSVSGQRDRDTASAGGGQLLLPSSSGRVIIEKSDSDALKSSIPISTSASAFAAPTLTGSVSTSSACAYASVMTGASSTDKQGSGSAKAGIWGRKGMMQVG